ncbi:MAG: YdcF family protein [Verrucomicrobiota bacterium]
MQPLVWAWLGLWVVAGRLAWRGDRVGGAAAAGLGLWLSLVGGTPLSGWLLARLERPYAVAARPGPGSADAICVLGGGHGYSPTEPAGFAAHSAFDRPLTGATLVGRGVATNLVFGGGFKEAGGRRQESGEAQVRWWRGWFPSTVRMEFLPGCLTTRDEAVRMAELARGRGWRRVVLVTSAWHLPRARAAFAREGLEVIPVGCDYEGMSRLEEGTRLPMVPTTGDLGLFTLWAHEVVGRGYYWLRGWG